MLNYQLTLILSPGIDQRNKNKWGLFPLFISISVKPRSFFTSCFIFSSSFIRRIRSFQTSEA